MRVCTECFRGIIDSDLKCNHCGSILKKQDLTLTQTHLNLREFAKKLKKELEDENTK